MMTKKRKKSLKLPIKLSVSQAAFYLIIGVLLWGTFWLTEGFSSVRLPQADHPSELYANQTKDDLRQVLSTSIGNAKESVLFIIYALNDEGIIQALKRKSEEGIDVRVICDAKASPHIVSRLGTKVNCLRRFSPGLMHQKILVIDGKQSWIGSANMTGESLRIHGNLITALDSAELAAMITAKSSTMTEYDPTHPVPHQEFMIGGQRAEMWFLPDDRGAANYLIKLIKSAQKTVRVAMFTWTRNDLARAVTEAKNRGVDVQVVIDHNSGKGASNKIVSQLFKEQVNVSLSDGAGLLHHKFLYIDGKTLVNGSANWTRAAFTKNDDCFIVLHDLTEEQKGRLDKLWDVILEESQPVK